MVYTKQEKQEIERVLAVFAKYLNQRNHCDIAWSNKLGYLLLDYHTCSLYLAFLLLSKDDSGAPHRKHHRGGQHGFCGRHS